VKAAAMVARQADGEILLGQVGEVVLVVTLVQAAKVQV